MKQSHQPRSGLHPPDSPDVTHFGVNPFLIQPMVGIRKLMPTMGYRIKPLCGKNNEAPTENSEDPIKSSPVESRQNFVLHPIKT